jgi:hypothetical protein
MVKDWYTKTAKEIHSGDVMPAVFALDPSDGLPLYMQLINVIKRAIAEGQLRPGDAIPGARTRGNVGDRQGDGA